MAKTTVKLVVELDVEYNEKQSSKTDIKALIKNMVDQTLNNHDFDQMVGFNNMNLKGIGVNLKKSKKTTVEWG